MLTKPMWILCALSGLWLFATPAFGEADSEPKPYKADTQVQLKNQTEYYSRS
jgi:hypothetical protein